MKLNYPQYQVVPFTYNGTTTGFLTLALSGPNASWQVPPLNGSSGFTSLISSLNLQAAKNLAQYPYAYVVGNGANNWSTTAAAQAAAQADYTTITAARDAAAQSAALSTTLPNAYVSLGTAVSGPG